MKCFVHHQVALSSTPEGPVAAYLDAFASSLSAKGYARSSIRAQVLLAAGFSQWLKQEGIELHRISSQHLPQYLRFRARRRRPCLGDHAALAHLIECLRLVGVIPSEKKPVCRATAAERCVQAYEQHLRNTRGLATATIANYVLFVRRFLQHRFGDGPVALPCLSARDVVEFVQRQAAGMQAKRAKLMTTALRSFFRYVRYCGGGTLDLAAAVPAVANWSMTSIPRAISPDQVHQLLTSFDRSTAEGRRDYAIVLLLARLGLRAGEVAFLDLDDIDWNTATLHVRAKGGMPHELPLSYEVGEAIADYLRHSRPSGNSRRVFLRIRAPVRGFRDGRAVGWVVRRSLQRTGMKTASFGAHQFRHGLATEMVRRNTPLSEIGEVLGHRHPDTTRIYAKVDLEALRALAMPWPGGAR